MRNPVLPTAPNGSYTFICSIGFWLNTSLLESVLQSERLVSESYITAESGLPHHSCPPAALHSLFLLAVAREALWLDCSLPVKCGLLPSLLRAHIHVLATR
jgi:hypothetical protein